MRTISGCIRSTSTDFLPFISGILPPTTRRNAACLELHRKSQNPDHLLHGTLHVRHVPNRLRSRRPSQPFMENLTNHDYSPLQYQIRRSHISLVSLTLHQDATCRAKHGFNLTACAQDTAGLTQTCTEWDWMIIKTACAATSNPPVTSSITVLLCPLHATSPTPPMKTWSNIFAILPSRFNRVVLQPVSCVYTTEEEWHIFNFWDVLFSVTDPYWYNNRFCFV